MRAPVPMPRNARPGGYPAPKPKFDWKRLMSPAGDALSDFGYGLAKGGFDDAFGIAAERTHQLQPYRDRMAKEAKTESEQAAARNATVEWLKSKAATDPRYAEIVAGLDAGAIDVGSAWQAGMAIAGEKPAGPMKMGKDDILIDPATHETIWQGPGSAPDPKDTFSFQSGLSKEYGSSAAVQAYEGVRTNYEKVQTAAQQASGAGDMSLIFGFMKMLDPASTVREGEYASAQDTGGIPAQIVNLYNKALTGVFLTPEQRADFLRTADGLYQEAVKNLEPVNQQFSTRAGQYGVDPSTFLRQPETYQPLTPPSVTDYKVIGVR